MLNGAFQNVGDDLHVAMGMRRETLAAGDAVLIDDAQSAEAHMVAVVVFAERPHLAASRPKQPRKEHREGRLPASVGPGDREGAAAPNGCRHPVERRSLAAWI